MTTVLLLRGPLAHSFQVTATHVKIWYPQMKATVSSFHDDVIKWKHFPRNWPFVRGIHRSPVNSPHKGQWRGALMFTLICVWINGCVNNRKAGDLRRYCAHYGVTVMFATKLGWLESKQGSRILVQVAVVWGTCANRSWVTGMNHDFIIVLSYCRKYLKLYYIVSSTKSALA